MFKAISLMILLPFALISCGSGEKKTEYKPGGQKENITADQFINENLPGCISEFSDGQLDREVVRDFCKCLLLDMTSKFSTDQLVELYQMPPEIRQQKLLSKNIGVSCEDILIRALQKSRDSL